MDRADARSVLDEAFAWDVGTWSRAWEVWTATSRLPLGSAVAQPIRAVELGGGPNAGVTLALGLLTAAPVHLTFASYLPIDERVRRRHRGMARQRGVSHARLDGRRIGLRSESVDLVVAKSVLGGIGRGGDLGAIRRVTREIFRVLRPGGEYWFADNARGSGLHARARARFGAGRDDWTYLTEAELRSALTDFGSVELEGSGVIAAFGRSEGQRRALARIDRRLEAALPRQWRYVLMGVARKAPIQ